MYGFVLFCFSLQTLIEA